MKKFMLGLALIATVMVVFSSCASSKRDCNGVRHYTQQGGFYL